MFIEVLHDSGGNIMACYCSDTLPAANGSPFAVYSGIPEGCVQARVNIDTITAMEIEDGCGLKAVIDPETREPVLVRTERPEYIMSNFTVDTVTELDSSSVLMPSGMKMRGLVRKA